METDDQNQLLSQLLPEISTYLRYSMANLHFAAAALAPAAEREQDPNLDARAAILDQSYYQLLRLVNNLSTAACLSAEKLPTLQDRDVVDLAKGVCRQCGTLASLLGLELAFECEASFHVCAVNRDLLEQLLFQLLSNAFKFTPKGGQITVALKFSAHRLFLSVTDNGHGIPQDLLDHLFDRYLQKDALHLPPHGLGLGLPLCRRIAYLHGGTIMAESREGEGTRITLSIPDRQAGGASVEDRPFDYAGGFNRTLLGLADALPSAAFLWKNQE